MGVDATTYREAMSRLGAAVNIITTHDEAGRHGLTASAVCSVTDKPPTLLVCVNRGARSRPTIQIAEPICINTLAHSQQDVSAAFSSRLEMAERFAVGTWTTLETGAPVLEQALMSFDCIVASIVEVGTHSVVFCAIQAIRLGDPAEGLMYFARNYHSIGERIVPPT